MEGLVIIIGLCVTFAPAIFFGNYVINKPLRETKFDFHIKLVKEQKGNFGVAVAYLERFLYGLTITTMGILLSEYFRNMIAIEILIISVISYFIVRYFDEKNEKK